MNNVNVPPGCYFLIFRSAFCGHNDKYYNKGEQKHQFKTERNKEGKKNGRKGNAYDMHARCRVTGYKDLPGIMIRLTKIKIKTAKRHSKYHYIQCISAVVIYRI